VTPEIFTEYTELLEDHCNKVGRNRDNIEISMGDILHINEDKTELRRKVEKYKPDELTQEAYMNHLIGTPEKCIERVQMYQDLGVNEFVMQIPTLNTGDYSDLRLFAEKVFPSF
jgi:alkanesulfonate monooxygenase SsuD/methylene tetrahydromethanopterin reductase-like flavin-dependent oxidoreductase (luciferase family)